LSYSQGWHSALKAGVVVLALMASLVAATPGFAQEGNSAPSCGTSSQDVPQDTPTQLGLHCWDANGDQLTFEISVQPEHGALGPLTTQMGWTSVRYTPLTGYHGPDSFEFTADDGVNEPVTGTMNITVTPPKAPTCGAVSTVNVRSNRPKNIHLPCWGHQNGGQVKYSITDEPEHGTVSFPYGTQSPTATYTPDTGFEGTDSFAFRATNDVGPSPEVTQQVSVSATANERPQCWDPMPASFRKGSTRTFSLSCSDADGDQLTFKIVEGQGPTGGTLSSVTPPLSSGGPATVTYTPNADFEGDDAFKFVANDGFADSTIATQRLSVKGADYNTVPQCWSDPSPRQVEEGNGQSTSFGPSCQDAEGDALTYEISAQPQHGTLTKRVTSAGPGPAYTSFEYKPDSGYRGADSFSYRADDGRGASQPVQVALNVTAPKPPQCQGTGVTHKARSGSVKNVFTSCFGSMAGGQVTYEITRAPQHGTATLPWGSGSGTVAYKAADGYEGTDSVALRATNSAGSTTTELNFLASPNSNDKPMCFGMGMGGDELRAGAKRTYHLSCQDPDGDRLTFRVVEPPTKGAIGDITQPAAGHLMSGSVTYTAGETPGSDFFRWVASDGRSESDPVGQAIAVREADWNTAPSCGFAGPMPPGAGGIQVERGSTGSIGANCTDRQNDPLSYAITSPPQHGAVTKRTSSWGSSTHTWFEYRPEDGYTGADSFAYRATDDRGASASEVTVDLAVVPPKPPTCFAPPPGMNSTIIRADRPKTMGLMCSGSQAGGPATYEITDPPDHATITFPLGRTSGQIKYAPEPGFTGKDSFSYRASNSAGTSATVTQEITVSSTHNVVPSCFPGAQSRTRTETAKVLSFACYDQDGDPLSYTVVDGPDHGSLGEITQPKGDSPFDPARVTYTPDEGFTGPDRFTFEVSDGTAKSSSPVTHEISVIPADQNTPPRCVGGMFPLRVAGNSTLEMPAGLPCWDAEDDALTAKITDAPDHGTLGDPDASGVRTYTPDTGFKGTDSFEFKANDGRADSAESTRIEIQVTDPAQVVAEGARTPSGEAVRIENYVDEKTGESFVTVPSSQAAQFQNGCMPLKLSTEINPGAGTIADPTLKLTPDDGTPAREFALTGGDSAAKSTWSAEIDCVRAGDLTVEYDLSEEGTTQQVSVPLGGIVLIDPQGVVYDQQTYDAQITQGKTEEQARSAAAISGARVVLQRKVDGEWRRVLSGDPGISPNVNPQITGANGLYQWDVSPGTYRVVVTKDGYDPVTSAAVNIPPPVLDLHVPLTKAAGPSGGSSGGGGGVSGGDPAPTPGSTQPGGSAGDPGGTATSTGGGMPPTTTPKNDCTDEVAAVERAKVALDKAKKAVKKAKSKGAAAKARKKLAKAKRALGDAEALLAACLRAP
jgi:hypothetical protein